MKVKCCSCAQLFGAPFEPSLSYLPLSLCRLLWEFLFESFGAINSIKMQFEGFVILNNAKTVLG